MKILNFWNTYENNIVGWRGTLRVLRVETWLTVYRTIAIIELGQSGGAHAGARHHENIVCNNNIIDNSSSRKSFR